MTDYANRVTAKFLALDAAAKAGGAPVNFLPCTVLLGDGGAAGAPPALSDMLAAGGVTHEVWRGAAVVSCQPNAIDDTQIDIGLFIPAAIGGAEIGPFQVNEVAILHPDGGNLVSAQMNAYKGVAGTGLPGDLALIIQVGASPANVVITPPTSGLFASVLDVQTAVNTHQPTAIAPLTQTDTTVLGWLDRVFGIRAARQPAATGTVVAEADASGYGRPATDAEFAAGVSAGGFAWPWATLAQIKAAFAAITIYGVTLPLTRDDTAKKYGVNGATSSAAGVARAATSGEVTARAAAGGAMAFVRPEDLPAPPATPPDPWGTGLGAIMTIGAYVAHDYAAQFMSYDMSKPQISAFIDYASPGTQLLLGRVFTGSQLMEELGRSFIPGAASHALAVGYAAALDARVGAIADGTSWTLVRIAVTSPSAATCEASWKRTA